MKVFAVPAEAHTKLKRGKVWCVVCGRTQDVDSAECLRNGWPKCCGQTMTLDSPQERIAFAAGKPEGGAR